MKPGHTGHGELAEGPGHVEQLETGSFRILGGADTARRRETPRLVGELIGGTLEILFAVVGVAGRGGERGSG